MKRVVAFLDMIDEIPANAKYLFSRKAAVGFPGSVVEINVVNITIEGQENSIYIHYYEVDSMDFEELMDGEFCKKNSDDKIKEFVERYKVSTK